MPYIKPLQTEDVVKNKGNMLSVKPLTDTKVIGENIHTPERDTNKLDNELTSSGKEALEGVKETN